MNQPTKEMLSVLCDLDAGITLGRDEVDPSLEKELMNRGWVMHDTEGDLCLTDAGRSVAEQYGKVTASEAEVVWEGHCVCLVVKRIDYPGGPPAYAVMHTMGRPDRVIAEWHPERTPTFDEIEAGAQMVPILTAYLCAESLDALCEWWTKKRAKEAK
ncbi:MAG: hypothetical protein CW346_19585 [Bacillaceae bacterium]|nr:hypothetical protein [Bacillaceae bacterium]